MCRLLAYGGPAIPLERMLILPRHSLLHQSRAATEAKLSVNGDGFGLGWYREGDPLPGQYRDTPPAWSDTNLASLCRMIHAPLFLAHVRAATFGDTARANCQPFAHDRILFAHNGQLGGFGRRRRAYEALIPDALYRHRAGVTDSEILFLALLANGLGSDPGAAAEATLAQISRIADSADGPTRIACVWSDGTDIWALRWSSDGRSPTLYASARPLASGGQAFASEPLDGDESGWHLLPEASLTRLGSAERPTRLAA